jgi:hypothetical protein
MLRPRSMHVVSIVRLCAPAFWGRLRIRAKSGHKRNATVCGLLSGKAYLVGRRSPSPISLKTRASVAAAGETISGHALKLPLAGATPISIANAGAMPTLCYGREFWLPGSDVTTFRTYSQPTPSRLMPLGWRGGALHKLCGDP